MGYNKNGEAVSIPAEQIQIAVLGKDLEAAVVGKDLGGDVKNTLEGGEIDSPPSVAAVNKGLSKKADLVDVQNELGRKANVTEVNIALSKKADRIDVDRALQNKANVADLSNKQDKLVSGSNIKTINSQSILGSGNIDIQGGSGGDDSWLKGKKVAIVGDSISTNGNSGDFRNVPEIKIELADVGKSLSAYLTYDDVNANLSLGGHTFTASEIGTEVTFTPTNSDVGKVIGLAADYNKSNGRNIIPWWMQIKDKLEFTPIPVCWSGSSITSHDIEAPSYKKNKKFATAHCWHPAQIRKMGVRTPGTMNRTPPDVVIIYRGTNDFSHDNNCALNHDLLKDKNFTIPSTDLLPSGKYGYKEGLCMAVKAIRDAYPKAIIFLCTLNNFKRVNYASFPVNNGTDALPQYNNAIREVAEYMGCGLIDFDKDGITYWNCYPQYIADSPTIPTHPTTLGHKLMGDKAINDLLNQKYNL